MRNWEECAFIISGRFEKTRRPSHRHMFRHTAPIFFSIKQVCLGKIGLSWKKSVRYAKRPDFSTNPE